ncbi:formate dehydrogenase accessory protein FdhE [Chloroflexota bacterium]
MRADLDSKILKKLDEQKKEEGKLPLLLAFFQKLTLIHSRAVKRFGVPETGLSRQAGGRRIHNGLPLLTFEHLVLDWPLLRENFVEVVAAFADYPGLFGEIPEKLTKPAASRLLTKKAVKAWFNGDELPPAMLASGVSEYLLQAIIHATLSPFLTSYSKVLIDLVDQERWRRRYCPVCGGSADFAFLDKERGSRWLLCSRCDTGWLYQRLECPYCGTREQKDLSYFTDDEGIYRLYLCERCKHYLKAIDLQKTEYEVLLPLERFYTLDIDSQARQRGYSPYDMVARTKEEKDIA